MCSLQQLPVVINQGKNSFCFVSFLKNKHKKVRPETENNQQYIKDKEQNRRIKNIKARTY